MKSDTFVRTLQEPFITSQSVLDRFQGMVSAFEDTGLLQVRREGDRLLFHTGDRAVRGSRLLSRLGSVLGRMADVILAFFSPWGWAALGLSLAVQKWRPSQFSSHQSLDVDCTRK